MNCVGCVGVTQNDWRILNIPPPPPKKTHVIIGLLTFRCFGQMFNRCNKVLTFRGLTVAKKFENKILEYQDLQYFLSVFTTLVGYTDVQLF